MNRLPQMLAAMFLFLWALAPASPAFCRDEPQPGVFISGAQWPQTARLAVSPALNGRELGASAALDSGGGLAAAGAPGDSSNRGAVYIFKRPETGWADASSHAKLTAAPGKAGECLGQSVAMTPDGSVLAAGASGANLTDIGSVYVFERPSTGWGDAVQTARLSVPGGGGVKLGQSVSISADGSIIAAGAMGENMFKGAVYIFKRPQGGWADAAPAAKLEASDPDAFDALGWSAAVSADGSTVAAGAVMGDRENGMLYVFARPAGGWASATETARLTAAAPTGMDSLGDSAALSSDGSIIAAGATGALSDRGAVFVYQRPPGGWADAVQDALLTAANGAAYDNFGRSVGVNPGGSAILVGAPGTWDENPGAAYVFERPAGGWADADQSISLVPGSVAVNNFFGGGVAMDAQAGIFLAGAQGEPEGGDQGAVYVFSGRPRLTTAAPRGLSEFSVISGGNVTSQGRSEVTARGVCWSMSPNPTTSGDKTEDGSGTGEFTSHITGLEPGTTYHLRAYAVNKYGTSYGREYSFTTDSPHPPQVNTKEPADITDASATSGGNVTSQGSANVTARGVCWSTSPNPTTSGDKTEDGSGTGEFTSHITGLEPGTTYHLRAYAVNKYGTSYGREFKFTTQAHPPRVETGEASQIKDVSAVAGGNVTSQGSAQVTERGICWSSSPGPAIHDNKSPQGAGAGVFSCILSGLAPYTRYYYRAYAVNRYGVSYGDEKSFRTAIFSPDHPPR